MANPIKDWTVGGVIELLNNRYEEDPEKSWISYEDAKEIGLQNTGNEIEREQFVEAVKSFEKANTKRTTHSSNNRPDVKVGLRERQKFEDNPAVILVVKREDYLEAKKRQEFPLRCRAD